MTDLLVQGINLAVLGIGTVFAFLTILVAATALMSVVVAKSEHRADVSAEHDDLDPTILAAAVAAVDAHRNKNANRP